MLKIRISLSLYYISLIVGIAAALNILEIGSGFCALFALIFILVCEWNCLYQFRHPRTKKEAQEMEAFINLLYGKVFNEREIKEFINKKNGESKFEWNFEDKSMSIFFGKITRFESIMMKISQIFRGLLVFFLFVGMAGRFNFELWTLIIVAIVNGVYTYFMWMYPYNDDWAGEVHYERKLSICDGCGKIIKTHKTKVIDKEPDFGGYTTSRTTYKEARTGEIRIGESRIGIYGDVKDETIVTAYGYTTTEYYCPYCEKFQYRSSAQTTATRTYKW